MIGSLPHRDPKEACDLVLRYPGTAGLASVAQTSFWKICMSSTAKVFPGIVLEDQKYTWTVRGTGQVLEQLYEADLEIMSINSPSAATY